MTPASLSVSASVFDATPGDASTIAATCDGQLRTNARRPSATGGWGSRKRVHRRLLVCLRLFDLTRRRVMEFEGSRARVPWGGRESAVDALPPRGCRSLRRIAVFFLADTRVRVTRFVRPLPGSARCFLSKLLRFPINEETSLG